jgi:hypothetical protein
MGLPIRVASAAWSELMVSLGLSQLQPLYPEYKSQCRCEFEDEMLISRVKTLMGPGSGPKGSGMRIFPGFLMR